MKRILGLLLLVPGIVMAKEITVECTNKTYHHVYYSSWNGTTIYEGNVIYFGSDCTFIMGIEYE